MDAEARRRSALVITIVFVVALTGFMTWGVLHKIKKGILEPAAPQVVDIMVVPTTKAK